MKTDCEDPWEQELLGVDKQVVFWSSCEAEVIILLTEVKQQQLSAS